MCTQMRFFFVYGSYAPDRQSHYSKVFKVKWPSTFPQQDDCKTMTQYKAQDTMWSIPTNGSTATELLPNEANGAVINH